MNTLGSGVLSTTLGAAGGVFATAGNGGFAGAVVAGGVPAATVSPGAAGLAVLADGTSFSEVSTGEPSVRLNYTLQRCIRVKIIQLPAMQGSLSAQVPVFVYT